MNRPEPLATGGEELPEAQNEWLIILSVALGLFMVVIDITILNIALPTLSRTMSASLEELEWALMAYGLGLTGLVPVFGRISDVIGRKRLYLVGMLVFSGASLLAALSPTILWLIGARLIQAVGGALITSNTLAIITDAFPAGRRGLAMGLQSIVISGGAAIGPALGGFLVTHFGWQSVFLINVPIGAVGALLSGTVLPPLKPGRSAEPIDWLGAAALMSGITLFLLGVTKGPAWGWSSSAIGGLLAVGSAILILFLFYERRTAYPILDPSLFRIREFAAGQGAGLLATISMASLTFLLPFYWQGLRGFSAQTAGLLMLPISLTLMVVAPLSGKASDLFGTRGISTAGLILIGLGLFLVSRVTAGMPVWEVVVRLMVFSAGFGMFVAPNNNAVMSSVPAYQRGVASGLLGMFRYMGQSLGVAFAGTLFALLAAHAGGPGLDVLRSLMAESSSLNPELLTSNRIAFMDGLSGVTLISVLFALVGALLLALRGAPSKASS